MLRVSCWHRQFNSKSVTNTTFCALHARLVSSASNVPERLGFVVSELVAQGAFEHHHQSFITSKPRNSSRKATYLPFYLYKVSTRTEFRAAIGRQMSVPYRDPQTGKVSQRFKTVWTSLPYSYRMQNTYDDQDPRLQVYAGFGSYRSLINQILPIDPNEARRSETIRLSQTAVEESFELTSGFANSILQKGLLPEEQNKATQMIRNDHGVVQVRFEEFETTIDIRSQHSIYIPAYVFDYTYLGRTLQTIVSGINAKTAGLTVYDSILTGVSAGSATAVVMFLLLRSPVFSLLMFGAVYYLASLGTKWYPVFRSARMEAQRTAERIENAAQPASSRGEGRQGQAGFGGFDPFEQFGGFGNFGGFRRQSSSQRPGSYGQQGSYGGYTGYGGQGSSSGQNPFASKSTSPDPKGLYKALGVAKSASKDEIQTAFRKAAMSKHPDKVPEAQKQAASAEFAKINEAYRVLRNDQKRKGYDSYGTT